MRTLPSRVGRCSARPCYSRDLNLGAAEHHVSNILAKLALTRQDALVGQLIFDQDVAEQMDSLYRTRDIVRRRELVRAALGVNPGDRVLDLGCGPGFGIAELLDRVGATGSIVGVDRSPQMLSAAARRCAGHRNVTLHEADVAALPVDDAAFDRALSVQVIEYVPDVTAALAELRRVVRPGGRVVVWDVDWSTLSWHSSDPARMDRVL